MVLFYDTVGPAASGTAVARTAINATYRVPAKARELVGVMPFMQAEAPSTSDSILAVGDIYGNDYRYQPCEFLFPVGNGKLGALNELEATPMEVWLIHAPLNGNETLNVGVEPCSAIATDNGQAGVTMIYSTVRTGRPIIYGKFSREIAHATAAGTITAGTDIRVDNGIKMKELCGVVTHGAGLPAASEEQVGVFTMRSTGWTPIQETRFFHEPVHAAGTGATSAPKIMGIMRLPFDALFKSKQTTVHTELYNYDAMNAAGVFVHGIRWLGS